MIVLADVPFFDAFTHAKSLSKGGQLSYWSSGEKMPISNSDIFGSDDVCDVCFVCSIKNLDDVDSCILLNKSYKFLFLWNCEFEKVKQYLTKKNVEFKNVSIHKYIYLNSSISQSAEVDKNIMADLIKDIELTPLSERLQRDSVSSILHKINVTYAHKQSNCSVADLTLGVSASSLDMTNAFCKSENDFINFCYYYFGNRKDLHPQMSLWIYTVSKFLMSNGDTDHAINKSNLNFSSKLTEMVYQKLKGTIKQEDHMFCSLCWLYISRIKTLESCILAIVYMRSAIAGKVNKKHSINLIRNLNEQKS